jgi:four helix bundle suffix protein
MDNPLIPKHGGYRKLKSFQVSQLAYDVTVRFCDKYIDKRSRTHDQMVQAARSGVQNIAEGSQASSTSRKMEMKLTNVARASLEELRLDYEDFLRQRSMLLWEPNDPRRAELVRRRPANADAVVQWAVEMQQLVQSGQSVQSGLDGRSGRKNTQSDSPKSTSSNKSIVSNSIPEIAANGVLVLINVACTLLDRQINALAKSFIEEGGFTERLYRTRKANR